MNLNLPVDLIGEGEYAMLENVRSYQDGVICTRPGLTVIDNSSFTPTMTPTTDYLHSMVTVSDLDPLSPGGPSRYAGYNDDLYWQDIGTPGNPFLSLTSGTGGFSGDPLSLVTMRPRNYPGPWLYVGDSQHALSKFSSSFQSGGVPILYSVGLPMPYGTVAGASPVPSDPPSVTAAGGSLTGDYYWRYQFRDPVSGARSYPGPVSGWPNPPATGGALTLAAGAGQMTIPSSVPSGWVVDVYRWGGTVLTWKLVSSEQPSASFLDDTSDIVLLSSADLDFDLYQPFVTPDVSHTGVVNTAAAIPGVTSAGGKGSVVTRASGDNFDTSWLIGSAVVIDGVACTILRVISSLVIEVNEDLGVRASVTWTVDAGILRSGQPLSHLWGPYGAGQFGVYMFGCGDPRAPGTLYWTNGNDPDTQGLENSLEITSPSEPLVNGCIYDGRCYVWSTERMFLVYPSLVAESQFQAQVVPGARGLIADWMLAVGEQIYFGAKDGIYATNGSTPVSMTDRQLRPFFPKDGQPGYSFQRGGRLHYPPDPSALSTWRLSWSQGQLYFDYTDTQGAAGTLVYDGHIVQGWIFDDYHFDGRISRYWEEGRNSGAPNTRYDLLIGIGSVLYQSTAGKNDGSFDIQCVVEGGSFDGGDARAKKLWGDVVTRVKPNGVTVNALLLGDNGATLLAAVPVTASGGNIGQTVFDLNSGAGALNRVLGVRFSWSGPDTALVELYDWTVTYVPKPPDTAKRATDWSDDGYVGSKFVKGVVIESNISVTATGSDLAVDAVDHFKVSSATYTFVAGDVNCSLQISGTGWTPGTYTVLSVAAGVARLDRSPAPVGTLAGTFVLASVRTVDVQYDGGAIAATLNLSAPGQFEQAFAIVPPVVARELRLLPTDALTCQLYTVRWIWDKYPEYIPGQEDYQTDKWPTGKYIRGVAIEGDSQGIPITFTARYDSGSTVAIPNVTQTGKTLSVYGFAVPFLASEITLYPSDNWRRHSVRWIYDEYPDFAALFTPWDDAGSKSVKYIRGAILQADTAGVPVTLTPWMDGAAVAQTFILNLTGQRETIVVFDPPIAASTMRWQPDSSWRFWSCKWIADEYPYLSALRTTWSAMNHYGPKYVRGLRFCADSANLPVTVRIEADGGTVVNSFVAMHNGRSIKPYYFTTPFVVYMTRFAPQGSIRIFESEVEWIFDPYPDLAVQVASWTNAGRVGDKFMQGARITADSLGLPVIMDIRKDGGVLAVTLPTASYTDRQTVPFSWPPFYAHNLQIVTKTPGARLFLDQIEWVFEPAPELASLWQTPMLSAGFPTWWHHRDGFIGHVSTANVTLTITREDGSTEVYSIPHGSDVYKRSYLVLGPPKAKARSYTFSSQAPFRLYVQDSLVNAKSWAGKKFAPVQVFGDASAVKGAAI